MKVAETPADVFATDDESIPNHSSFSPSENTAPWQLQKTKKVDLEFPQRQASLCAGLQSRLPKTQYNRISREKLTTHGGYC